MDNAENIKLIRRNDALHNEVEKLKQLLDESRTALIYAQATSQALSEICMDTLGKARAGALDDMAITDIASEINLAKAPEWKVSLCDGILERGFNAGFRFARLKGKNVGDKDNAMQVLRDQTATVWPPAKKGVWRMMSPPSHHALTRYHFAPDDKDNPFDFDTKGEYVEYAAYASLKLHYDVLNEALNGYQWLVHDPLNPPFKKKRLADGCTGFLRRPRKEGILKAQFGRNQGEQDFMVLYGDGVPACDRALLFHTFGSPRMAFDHNECKPVFESSFLEELDVRGYDMSTFRFSVCKKQPAEST